MLHSTIMTSCRPLFLHFKAVKGKVETSDLLGSLLGNGGGKGGMDLVGLMNMGKGLFK